MERPEDNNSNIYGDELLNKILASFDTTPPDHNGIEEEILAVDDPATYEYEVGLINKGG